jgi:hypothetical protein
MPHNAVLTMPVACLAGVRPRAHRTTRIEALVAAYRAGAGVPPIPVRLSTDGAVSLSRDGNHRLAAVRQAGITEVQVAIDARDLPEAQKLAQRARAGAGSTP